MIHTCPTWFESETMRKCHVTVCPLLLARLSTNKSLTLAGQIVVEHAHFEVAQVAPACFEPVAGDKPVQWLIWQNLSLENIGE